jgi:multidrug efflux system outer membrane protein
MRRLVAAGALAFVAAACVGPSFREPNPEAPADWRPTPAVADTLRPFYDSLRAHRDTEPLEPAAPAPSSDTTREMPARVQDTTANLAWFDLLIDPELRKLVETSLRENRDLKVAVAAVLEFRAQLASTRGNFFPQITGNGVAGRTKTTFGSLGAFTFNQIQLTANLSWELDVWGRIRRATEAARADLLGQEENQRAVVLSLVGSVASAYLQLRQLDLQLEISRRTLDANRETLRLARRRFSEGVISELDVRQFESEVASPAATVAQVEGQIVQAEDQLSVLVGRNPGGIPRGRPLPDVLGSLKLPQFLPSTVLDRRPDVQLAKAQLHAAVARIGAAEANLFPTFTVVGDYGTYSPNTSGLFKSQSEIYQILGEVSVPIFTGGVVGKQVDVARARADQARYTYQQAVLTALREVEDAFAGVRSTRNQVAAQQTQVDALRRALTLAQRRYESGLSSYLDLLDAQRSLFSAELSLAQAQGSEATAAVTLYQALGGGWPVVPGDTLPVDRSPPPR